MHSNIKLGKLSVFNNNNMKQYKMAVHIIKLLRQRANNVCTNTCSERESRSFHITHRKISELYFLI